MTFYNIQIKILAQFQKKNSNKNFKITTNKTNSERPVHSAGTPPVILLSQIKDLVVVLRDEIQKELKLNLEYKVINMF